MEPSSSNQCSSRVRGILLSFIKELSSDICYHMGKPRRRYAKWNKDAGQILCGSMYMRCLQHWNSGTENRTVITRGLFSRRELEVFGFLNSYRFSLRLWKSYRNGWWWWRLRKIVNFLVSLTIYAKMIKIVNFTLCIFSHSEKGKTTHCYKLCVNMQTVSFELISCALERIAPPRCFTIVV